MITSWTLYWILKLDAIHRTFTSLGILSTVVVAMLGAGILISFIISKGGDDESRDVVKAKEAIKTLRNQYKWLAPIWVLTFVIGTLIPTTKEMAVIMVAPKILNSNFVQKDLPEEGKEVYGLFKQWLKDQVEPDEKGEK